MVSEDPGHGADTIIGAKMWGNKLCIPNQIRFDVQPDERSLTERLKDGVRAILGHPCSYYPPPVLQTTIRTYIEEKGAKVVATIRNPDHVVDSIVRRGNQPVEVGKHRWAAAVRDIAATKRTYGDEKVFVITFENLVSSPEAAAKDLSSFLNVPFDESMIEGYQHTPQYESENIDSSRAHKETKEYHLQGYDREAVEMYRSMLREAEAKIE
jgi:hypothetical protein